MQQINEPKMTNDRQNYARWIGFGIEFCGVLGVFCYMGYKLDVYLGTMPWFLLAGFCIGFSGMIYLILKGTGAIKRK